MTALEFDGIAFDPTGVGRDYAATDVRSDGTESASAANPIAEIRAGVVAAHRAALSAQAAMQWAVWRRAGARAGQPELPDSTGVPRPVAMPPALENNGTGMTDGGRRVAAREGAFKPLARSERTRLDRAALAALARGEVADVFGVSYRRAGVESAVRLAARGPLVLTEVTDVELYGGAGNGRVVAYFDGDTAAAATQAAELFALYTGMPLCLSGSTLSTGVVGAPVVTSGTVELVVEALDLVPRPFVRARAEFRDAAALEVTVMVVEAAGADVGPGGAVRGPLLNEFHMAHLARGDQGIAMGPEFDAYTGVRATRLPTGGLLLVDRVLTFDGARGQLDSASYTTEYDSPADSWYYADTANESMPHFVYMETSLQAALLMGYYAGPTLTQPGTTLSLRNLGGTATVLRQVDLRDRTIVQSSRLLSTTILPGSSLQTFDYTLSVDGAPFYRGETMFGYFSDEALANQTGLDAGRFAPTWLARHPEARTRVIDVAARRADPAARLCARRTLALIDRVEVVDGGGEHGAGYLRSLREIDPSDWFFARHFHLDPVIPGSLGVESVIHAVQEWMIDTGFASDMADPAFRIPADIAFGWRYRGQFLPTDGTVELEAHIKSVRREPGRVTVTVDGSLWKPGLRIYELVDLAIELVDRKARP
ncbi:hotdog family protein [Nocardia otitidiscaviarum]|uniref:beta-ketoacyl synthase n=1 Tax=Nocardia otitidiscaviarum TaxID=1823 RepID=UPI001895EA57|nr:beta-ketoacyl synthase [Nocardia otitidiscaviarum]MBF6177413.1 beta-ketoacyl synthase [Nocardia otitidiscaviarum]